jgi:hypothetical protein
MSRLLITVIIGIVAGIIDVIPMILQKLDKYANWSAFVHWIVLTIIISYLDIPWAGWLKGLVFAELSALPIMILVTKDDPKSAIPIAIMSAILGALVGIATATLAG